MKQKKTILTAHKRYLTESRARDFRTAPMRQEGAIQWTLQTLPRKQLNGENFRTFDVQKLNVGIGTVFNS